MADQQENRTPHFAAFAVSRTGNRGAVSMLEAAIDHLTKPEVGGVVDVFTVYPNADRDIPATPNVNLFNGTPKNLVLKLIPLSFLYGLLRAMRLAPRASAWGREMQTLIECDVVLLIGGTTFSDAQLFKVIFNVACALPAIFLGKRQMYYSQTLGPFNKFFNRNAARFCLKRAAVIHPRGPGSERSVHELGFSDAKHHTDSAFSLIVPDEVEQRIAAKFAPILEGKNVVGISTNSIVERKCRLLGIPHNRIWVEFITHLQQQGYFVLLVPHSMRLGVQSRHNNDLVTTGEILAELPSQENLHVVEEYFDCKELRVVVGLARYYVASRFHSMISCLCTATPVSVFGWGHHKYREVLADFDLEDLAHDAAELSTQNLIDGFNDVVARADEIAEKMRAALPKVHASSLGNHQAALELARRRA